MELVSYEQGIMRIKIPRGERGVSIFPESEVFERLLRLREKKVIVTFCARMPRLEDVYLQVTQQAGDEDGVEML